LGNNNVYNLEILENFHDQALKGCEILPKLGDRIQIQKKLHGRFVIVLHGHFEQQSLQIKVMNIQQR
jgi:hypothetical protein